MSMLVMLKEGGTLVIEAKGNTKLDEDLDFALNESGSGAFNYSLRWICLLYTSPSPRDRG